ncbi:hypothetical protein OPQ81_003348 [Rhizoctonia solani]|nr:hypothetical protein OPQ81_003348 [Rhizoctonia solani]
MSHKEYGCARDLPDQFLSAHMLIWGEFEWLVSVWVWKLFAGTIPLLAQRRLPLLISAQEQAERMNLTPHPQGYATFWSMKLLYSLSIIGTAGVVAGKVSRSSISTDGAEFSSKTFDYVVIGGGTAGLTLAARLAENPSTTVGVIEAGEYRPDDPLINTPGVAFSIPRNATYDWLLKSVPQVNSNNRVVSFPRGKILGGTSAINIMAFDRASKAEYDAWAKLGNPGWDWDGLLPSMKAAERFTGVDPFRVNDTNADPNNIFPSQGKDGLLAISYNNWYDETTLPFRNSMANLGIPTNFDPDSGNAFGTYNSARSVNDTTGRRSYSASTYYAYNAHRPNFVVLTGAQATKINFKDSANQNKAGKLVASGVSFVHKSQTYTVKARKEVILSAGTFQSPPSPRT